jgi:hypothetical protein
LATISVLDVPGYAASLEAVAQTGLVDGGHGSLHRVEGRGEQAAQSQRAIRLAAKYPQIKLLTSYRRVDVKGGTSVFSPPVPIGLRRPNGTKKPAWFALGRLRR